MKKGKMGKVGFTRVTRMSDGKGYELAPDRPRIASSSAGFPASIDSRQNRVRQG